jgi:hypothetical protein
MGAEKAWNGDLQTPWGSAGEARLYNASAKPALPHPSSRPGSSSGRRTARGRIANREERKFVTSPFTTHQAPRPAGQQARGRHLGVMQRSRESGDPGRACAKTSGVASGRTKKGARRAPLSVSRLARPYAARLPSMVLGPWPLPMGMFRGFMASGISRLRLMWSRPFSISAPTTST